MKARRLILGTACIAAAFALGCLPSARLVARLYGKAHVVDLGDGNPGAANIRRQLGMPAAVAVGALDITKGWLPARLARREGASDSLTGPLAMAPAAGHIFVLGGKGAAAALGGASAYDPVAMVITGAIILGVGRLWAHAPAVMVGGFVYPTVQWLLGRPKSHVAWAAGIVSLLMLGRLRGPRVGARSVSPRVLWERFWFDREPVD